MNRNEARKIAKTHTQTRYSNSVLLLLLKLIDQTYRKDQDDVGRPIEATASSLKKAAAVGDKQLRRILDQLTADGVLTELERTHKHIVCRLNLEPLTKLEPFGDKQKADKKAQAADRAHTARVKRAGIRKLERYVGAVREALNADLRDFTLTRAATQQ
jgi:hypothetical protein